MPQEILYVYIQRCASEADMQWPGFAWWPTENILYTEVVVLISVLPSIPKACWPNKPLRWEW